jgi:NADPH:quinone reductase-like Zn-dependent oxidoreductase
MTSSIPETMTAIAITEPGGPDVLVPTDLPVPSPGEREILVHVEAAGINRPDVLQRKGGYPPPPWAPATPGLEIAGWVAQVGPRRQALPSGRLELWHRRGLCRILRRS